MKLVSLTGAVVALLLSTQTASAQVAVGSAGGTIGGIGAYSGDWTAPGAPLTLPDADLAGAAHVSVPVTSVQCVTVQGLSHIWMGDVTLCLRDPNGVEHLLFTRPGFGFAGSTFGNDGDFLTGDYTFVDGGGSALPDDDVTLDIMGGCYDADADTGGAVWNDGDAGVNVGPLSAISGPAGDWTLVAYDWFQGADSGSFTGWSMSYNNGGSCPCGGIEPYPSTCNGDGGDQAGCTPCACGNESPQGIVGGCLNSSGTGGVLNVTGSASLTAADPGDLSFSGTGMTPSSFCVLVSGDNLAPQNAANPCFGTGSGVSSAVLDGVRCAVGNTLRHGGRPVAADGTAGLSTNGWGGANGPSPSIAAQGGFVAGQTRFFQAFYRELPGSVCLTEQNTTQARSVTFLP